MSLSALLLAGLLAQAPAGSAAAPARPLAPPMELFVDARMGDDGKGDGTAEKPFRTIRRALQLHGQVAERAAAIHLALGHYGIEPKAAPPAANPANAANPATTTAPPHPASAEDFPITLPPNVSLLGFGSESCELVGDPDLPVLRLAAGGECELRGLRIRGGATALQATRLAGGQTLTLRVVDLAIDDAVEDAVDLAPAAGAVVLRADGLRVRHVRRGIHVDGTTNLALALADARFRDCEVALDLDTTGAGDLGAHHDLALRRCRFELGTGAAVSRRGKAAVAADATPWLIDECDFVGNQAGISLAIPGGDQPFAITRCRFLENELHGFSAVGGGAPLDGTSTLRDCTFRWNGIGVNLLACGRRVELERCRIEDSLGNGLFAGIFVGQKMRVALTRCVLAANGACGVFGLTEQQDGLELALERCTVADNQGHGLERKSRKGGSGRFTVHRSIVAGNLVDVVRLAGDDVTDSWLGAPPPKGPVRAGVAAIDDGPSAAGGNGFGDPRFVDRAARDFRLAPDSPARRADGPLGALDDPPR